MTECRRSHRRNATECNGCVLPCPVQNTIEKNPGGWNDFVWTGWNRARAVCQPWGRWHEHEGMLLVCVYVWAMAGDGFVRGLVAEQKQKRRQMQKQEQEQEQEQEDEQKQRDLQGLLPRPALSTLHVLPAFMYPHAPLEVLTAAAAAPVCGCLEHAAHGRLQLWVCNSFALVKRGRCALLGCHLDP